MLTLVLVLCKKIKVFYTFGEFSLSIQRAISPNQSALHLFFFFWPLVFSSSNSLVYGPEKRAGEASSLFFLILSLFACKYENHQSLNLVFPKLSQKSITSEFSYLKHYYFAFCSQTPWFLYCLLFLAVQSPDP